MTRLLSLLAIAAILSGCGYARQLSETNERLERIEARINIISNTDITETIEIIYPTAHDVAPLYPPTRPDFAQESREASKPSPNTSPSVIRINRQITNRTETVSETITEKAENTETSKHVEADTKSFSLGIIWLLVGMIAALALVVYIAMRRRFMPF